MVRSFEVEQAEEMYAGLLRFAQMLVGARRMEGQATAQGAVLPGVLGV